MSRGNDFSKSGEGDSGRACSDATECREFAPSSGACAQMERLQATIKPAKAHNRNAIRSRRVILSPNGSPFLRRKVPQELEAGGHCVVKTTILRAKRHLWLPRQRQKVSKG